MDKTRVEYDKERARIANMGRKDIIEDKELKEFNRKLAYKYMTDEERAEAIRKDKERQNK